MTIGLEISMNTLKVYLYLNLTVEQGLDISQQYYDDSKDISSRLVGFIMWSVYILARTDLNTMPRKPDALYRRPSFSRNAGSSRFCSTHRFKLRAVGTN